MHSKCVKASVLFENILFTLIWPTYRQRAKEGLNILPRLSCQFPMGNNCLICTTCTQTTKLVSKTRFYGSLEVEGAKTVLIDCCQVCGLVSWVELGVRILGHITLSGPGLHTPYTSQRDKWRLAGPAPTSLGHPPPLFPLWCSPVHCLLLSMHGKIFLCWSNHCKQIKGLLYAYAMLLVSFLYV